MAKISKLWMCMILAQCLVCTTSDLALARQRKNNIEILISAAASLKDVM